MADIKEFKLPDLGEGLEEGDIIEWHVAVGDVIELNQTVADIETAKAVVAVPSPFAGKVVELVGEVGETLEVGSVFVRIDVDVEGGEVADDVDDAGPGEVAPADGAEAELLPEPGDDAAEVAATSSWDAEEEPQPLVGYGQGKAGGGRRRRRRGGNGAGADEAPAAAAGPVEVLAKPPVRKLAKDLGVELSAIAPGSGPDGIITRDDVQAAASGADAPSTDAAPTSAPATSARQPAPQPAASEPAPVRPSEVGLGFRGRQPGEVEQIKGIRKRIVEKMELSRREIPAASCTREADVTHLWSLARQLTTEAQGQGYDVKISPFAIVMRATLLGLRRFPTLNARIVGREGGDAGEIHLLEPIHLGFAADTDRGLVVPNIKDAHAKSLVELAAELAELAGKVPQGGDIRLAGAGRSRDLSP